MTAVISKENAVSAGENDVAVYLRQIRSYPMLTPEQERQLAMDCARGDEDAIRKMVNSNLRLVVSIAREYMGRGVPLMDLIQEGSIGLLTAAKKFDYTQHCRFSTYASQWIRQGISRCLINHAGLIRIPAHTAEKIRQLLKTAVDRNAVTVFIDADQRQTNGLHSHSLQSNCTKGKKRSVASRV